MKKFHVMPEQQSLLDEFAREEKRPSFELYMKYQKRMGSIKTVKPKRKSIPNVLEGHDPGEVVPLSGFNALNDLPAGSCIYPMWDSGNNHRIGNAGEYLLAQTWNAWVGY